MKYLFTSILLVLLFSSPVRADLEQLDPPSSGCAVHGIATDQTILWVKQGNGVTISIGAGGETLVAEMETCTNKQNCTPYAWDHNYDRLWDQTTLDGNGVTQTASAYVIPVAYVKVRFTGGSAVQPGGPDASLSACTTASSGGNASDDTLQTFIRPGSGGTSGTFPDVWFETLDQEAKFSFEPDTLGAGGSMTLLVYQCTTLNTPLTCSSIDVFDTDADGIADSNVMTGTPPQRLAVERVTGYLRFVESAAPTGTERPELQIAASNGNGVGNTVLMSTIDPAAPLYFNGSSLFLNTPGAGIDTEAHATDGQCRVWREGADDGTNTAEICILDSGLTASAKTYFNADGTLPGGGGGLPAIGFYDFDTNNAADFAYVDITLLAESDTAVIELDTVSTPDRFDLKETGTYEITWSAAVAFTYAAGTADCIVYDPWDITNGQAVTAAGTAFSAPTTSRSPVYGGDLGGGTGRRNLQQSTGRAYLTVTTAPVGISIYITSCTGGSFPTTQRTWSANSWIRVEKVN